MRRLPGILGDERSEATVTEPWDRSCFGDREPATRVRSGSVTVALAQTGVGGAALPRPTGRRAGLIELGPEIELSRTGVWCLAHRDLAGAPRVRAFTHAVLEPAIVGAEADAG
jgi:hypothetical protein